MDPFLDPFEKPYGSILVITVHLNHRSHNYVCVKEALVYFDTNLLRFTTSVMKVGIEDRLEVLEKCTDERILRKFPRLEVNPRLLSDWKALVFILDSDNQLPLIFTTSDYTKEEIQGWPTLVRKEVMKTYKFLQEYGDPNGWKPQCDRQKLKLGVEAKIESILSTSDAIHALESLSMCCDILLTSDYGVIDNRGRLQELGINVCSPFGLLSRVFFNTDDEAKLSEMERFWNNGLGLLLR